MDTLRRQGKECAQPLYVVIIAKTNLCSQARAHVIVFRSDLTLAAALLVDYYMSQITGTTSIVKNLGEKRASFISPMRSAIDKGIHAANHTDYFVTPMDQMFVVWTAVNRVSHRGKVIGPKERITPYEALKAITIRERLHPLRGGHAREPDARRRGRWDAPRALFGGAIPKGWRSNAV